MFFLFLGERPTLFSDIWSLAAVVLQWLLETPPWDFQELCARYKYRENKHVKYYFINYFYISMTSDTRVKLAAFTGK